MSNKNQVSKSVIFLDIDGVLQPLSSERRFNQDLKANQAELVRIEPEYGKFCPYDLGAVRWDWCTEAVANLKKLCTAEPDTVIVVSSNWRARRTIRDLQLLFKLHDLDSFIVDATPELSSRDVEILEYLIAHPEIERFVILDDSHYNDFMLRFPKDFVHTWHKLTAENVEEALAILRRTRRTKSRRALIDAFDAFMHGHETVTNMHLDLQDIGMLRMAQRISSQTFLESLCQGIESCPKLESFHIRDIEHDFTYEQRRALKPVEQLENAAKKNTVMKKFIIEKTKFPGHSPYDKGKKKVVIPVETLVSW